MKLREKLAEPSANTISEFGGAYLAGVVRVRFHRAKDTERYSTRDIFLAVGNFRLAEVAPPDVSGPIDRVKARGRRKADALEKAGRSPPTAASQAANQVRTLRKGLFVHAIARPLLTDNPVWVIARKPVAPTSRRNRALSHDELPQLLCGLNEIKSAAALVASGEQPTCRLSLTGGLFVEPRGAILVSGHHQALVSASAPVFGAVVARRQRDGTADLPFGERAGLAWAGSGIAQRLDKQSDGRVVLETTVLGLGW